MRKKLAFFDKFNLYYKYVVRNPMRPQSTFLPHFSNETMITVLLFFLLNPDEEAYLARIVRLTNKGLIQVQRIIKRLLESGLISALKHKKKTYYKADPTHLAFNDLKNLVLQTKVWSPTFNKEIKCFQKKIHFGFVFGSVAKGTHTATSDLDILFIGDLSLHEVSGFMGHLSRELFREVNIVIYTPQEFQEAFVKKNSFVTEVLESPKIWLFGNKNGFETLYRQPISGEMFDIAR
jgi:predicted nucleotidyltransferase